MWYVGVDAHKRKCYLTAKSADGATVRTKTFTHTREGWTDALQEFPKGTQVAFECVGWYQPVVDLLEDLGYMVHLVHAKDVTLIGRSKKKTDARDSEILVDLLRSGFLPTSYVPRKESRQLRELTRHLDDVVKRQIATKNRVHRLLERAWITLPEVRDIFGQSGRKFLAECDLARTHRLVLDLLLEEFDGLQQVRCKLEAAIALDVKDDEDTRLLMSISGISVMGAATLKAEIDTVDRFPNREAIRSNFGMAVSVRDSADTERRGHITKQGPGVVRKILVQGALHFVRHDGRAARKYDRLKQARGGSVARVAAANCLLATAYQMLKARMPYLHADPRRVIAKERELLQLAAKAPSSYVS